jgi:hypothetical protein
MKTRWLVLVLGGCSVDLSDVAEKIPEEEPEGKDQEGGKGDGEDGEGEGEEEEQEEQQQDPTPPDEIDVCTLGVAAYCFCTPYYGYECSPGDEEYYHNLCVNGEDYGVFECMASFVDTSGYVECYYALAYCT